VEEFWPTFLYSVPSNLWGLQHPLIHSSLRFESCWGLDSDWVTATHWFFFFQTFCFRFAAVFGIIVLLMTQFQPSIGTHSPISSQEFSLIPRIKTAKLTASVLLDWWTSKNAHKRTGAYIQHSFKTPVVRSIVERVCCMCIQPAGESEGWSEVLLTRG